ncbi:MAG: rubrerythrin family protein [Oscillospiraceae bacterium]|jgi:rubrerythrin|nr:rubrerythrin family protein [Oscillospiraceae bacterium]
MDWKNSETKDNLLRAFAGESQARNRYTFAAAAAKKANLEVIEMLFEYTAGQEKEHGEIFYNHLKEAGCDNIVITAGYPVDCTDDVQKLLKLAADHENDEYGDIYPAFAEKAQEEGFAAVAAAFRQIARIEKVHADRFKRFAQLMEQGKLFVSDVETEWMCLNCGHVQRGTKAPEQCPVCKHSQGYFIRVELSPYEK